MATLSAFLMVGQVELRNTRMSFKFDHVPSASAPPRLTLLAASAAGSSSSLVPGGFSELWQLHSFSRRQASHCARRAMQTHLQ